MNTKHSKFAHNITSIIFRLSNNCIQYTLFSNYVHKYLKVCNFKHLKSV